MKPDRTKRMGRKEEGSVQKASRPAKSGFVWEMKHNRTLYLMCVPGLLLLLAFAYLPMGGMYMAFTKFNVVDGIFGTPFVAITAIGCWFLGDVDGMLIA